MKVDSLCYTMQNISEIHLTFVTHMLLIYLDFPSIDEMIYNTLGTSLSTSLFSRLTTSFVYDVDKLYFEIMAFKTNALLIENCVYV